VSETGSVKFTCEHLARPLEQFAQLDELNVCRRKLMQLRVLGVDASGIGFGNISVRQRGTQRFYIGGSGTGGLGEVRPCDCAWVTAYDFAQNWVRSEGVALASSESLTHAALYEADEAIGAVIHGHNADLWRQLRGVAPTTSSKVEYGTPAMANEVRRLFRETDVRTRKLFVMGGHADGFVTFGRDLRDALAVLMHEFCSRESGCR